MRVTKLEVCDFRGFPGPGVYAFDFGNARNLLVYGENGSGKSSLFRAVQEFFSRKRPAKTFAELKNNAEPSVTDGHVTVHFDSGDIQTWQHGGVRQVAAPPSSQVALQLGCLDYRSLLETNFSHRGDTVNLFDIAVNRLVECLEVPVAGGGTARIGDLWRDVLASRPSRNSRNRVVRCQGCLAKFNGAFRQILGPLVQKATDLLRGFPGCGFDLALDFGQVVYEMETKSFRNQELILSIRSGGTTIANHHDFLNEAKLSAIGLAIYLAGLLISVPATSVYPKVLVLDDVLIGLDMGNRMPVLQLLANHFADWQVILMTHDIVWYEMVQLDLEGKDWKAYELYVGEDQAPRHYERDGGAKFFLERAREHLSKNDLNAAANYARSAFEYKIKKYCSDSSLPVPYKKNPREMKADGFWLAAQTAARKKAIDAVALAKLNGLFADVDRSKRIVLNPLSHSTAGVGLARVEVQSAIDAVELLQFK
jgi:energy-coupling factor transporter ATP-binding protein EcfA2